MSDWSKLKVVDLKKELSSRGLLQTGLKADLVYRLTEDDEAKAAKNSLPEDASEAPGEGQLQHGEASSAKDEAAEATEKDDVASHSAPTRDSEQKGGDKEESTIEGPSASTSKAEGANEASENLEGSTLITTSGDEKQPEEQQQNDLPTADEPSSANATFATDEVTPVQPTELPKQAEGSTESQKTSNGLPSEEVIVDSQKRKRRSLTPDIRSDDASNKKMRHSGDADDLALPQNDELATTKDDAEWVEKHNGVDALDVNAESMEVDAPTEDAETGTTTVDVVKEEVEIEPVDDPMDFKEETQNNTAQDGGSSTLAKARGGENIDKDLLPASDVVKYEEEDAMEDIEPDRMISPAIHSATTALYIRNFMRPINKINLKEYLCELAAPPSSHPDPSIISEFYLDPIRTHCLVSFANISAASRVRSAIHGTTWPEETIRKPLWADFVPPEKMLDWIAVEESSVGTSRIGGTKWEVVYEEDNNGNIVAELREADPRNVPARQIGGGGLGGSGGMGPPSAPRGIANAPIGPRSSLPQDPNPYENRNMNPDMNRRPSNFRSTAAEPSREGFMSTATSPPLYYQPVAKELVEQRLNNMDRITRPTYKRDEPATESNRYTFENGAQLVDRGPEIFEGIRPPPRGGYRGGGGGYRGDGGGGYRGRNPRGGDRYTGGADRYAGGAGGGSRYAGGAGGSFRDERYRGSGSRRY